VIAPLAEFIDCYAHMMKILRARATARANPGSVRRTARILTVIISAVYLSFDAGIGRNPFFTPTTAVLATKFADVFYGGRKRTIT
jgi:hypothetical protein